MTPLLTVVMGVPALTAVGTDTVYATATKVTGSIHNHRQRSVNLGVALFLGIGGIPGVLVGSRLAPRLPGKPLTIVLAVMLVFVGARLLLLTA